MTHLRSLLRIVAVTAVVLVATGRGGSAPQSQSQNPTRLDDYLENELASFDEAYALVARFGQQVWPGWTNYLEPPVTIDFPNRVHLLLPSSDKIPEGYVRVEGREIRGKQVYINRKEEVPLKLRPPFSGGGGGGKTITIMLSQAEKDPEPGQKNDESVGSESMILLEVHELFHSFQVKFPSFEAIGRRERGASMPSGAFVVDLNYATWSSVEGRALMAAFEAKDNKTAREYLEDYFVARTEKEKGMTPGAIGAEQARSFSEGTANYSNIKMAMLVRDAKYAGTDGHGTDPYFYKFSGMDKYLEQNFGHSIKASMDETLDTLGKYYIFGAYQCFALDRVAPSWKKGFFESGKTLDEVTSEVLKLTPARQEQIKATLRAKYKMEELEALHRPVIQDRDDALKLVAERKGRRYLVDFSKVHDFVIAMGRGKSVRLGVHVIHPRGIEHFTLSEVDFVGKETPMEQQLWTVEWVDTDAKSGEQGYEIKYGSKTDDVLKDVTITTKGFTLKAPEIQVVENKEKDEVRFFVLSKVKR